MAKRLHFSDKTGAGQSQRSGTVRLLRTRLFYRRTAQPVLAWHGPLARMTGAVSRVGNFRMIRKCLLLLAAVGMLTACDTARQRALRELAAAGVEPSGQALVAAALRQDAHTWDMGYTRTVVRPDGKLVTIYYYTTAERPEQHLEATIWEAKQL